jgi:hypothetical protein
VNPARPVLHARNALLPLSSNSNGPSWLFRQHQWSIVVVRAGDYHRGGGWKRGERYLPLVSKVAALLRGGIAMVNVSDNWKFH